MRVAIPCWRGRVSPVFDAARSLLLVDTEGGRELHREERQLTQTSPHGRALEMSGFGVDVLICGAVSAPLESSLAARGLRIFGFICGPIDGVLDAYLRGGLAGRAFRMPGCGGRPRFRASGEPGSAPGSRPGKE